MVTGSRIALRSSSVGNMETSFTCATADLPPGLPVAKLSISCGIANRPIMAVRKCTPAIRFTFPNVKRAVPMTGS